MQMTIAWLAAATLALPATAQDHAGHGERQAPRRPMTMQTHAEGGMHGGMGMPLMMEAHVFSPTHLLERRETVGLTEQQVQRLTQLQTESQAAHDRARQEVEGHFEQARQAWNTGDADGVTTHVRAGMQAMQQAHLTMVTASAQARAALTVEQRARVQGWMDAMGRMHQMRPGHQMMRGHDSHDQGGT